MTLRGDIYTYEGSVIDGLIDGIGLQRFDDGSADDGSIRAGTFSQQGGKEACIGAMFDKEGNITYVGRWANGKRLLQSVPLSALPCAKLP